MKIIKHIIPFLMLSFLISCSTTQRLYVAAETSSCTGVGEMECMLVKTNKNQKEWELFYTNIEGFTYEKGYEYELLVSKHKVANPPADASAIKYSLVKIIHKIKKT